MDGRGRTRKDEEGGPVRKKIRLTREGRVGVYTSSSSKKANTQAYVDIFRAQQNIHKTQTTWEIGQEKKIYILPTGERWFQLPAARLMEVIDRQYDNFDLTVKVKRDGVVLHNDLFMVFTFTLAWVRAFVNKLPAEQHHFVAMAKTMEQHAGRLIDDLMTSNGNQGVDQDQDDQDDQEEPFPTVAVNSNHPVQPQPALNLVRQSPECDSFVAIAAVRFASVFFIKRSCSLIRRIILQRVLVDKWNPPAGCDVHVVELKPRTRWKEVLLGQPAEEGYTERAKRAKEKGRPCTAFHWRCCTSSDVWWGKPPAAGSRDELLHLCRSLDHASRQAQQVITEHHQHHPQYGTTRRDLTVFTRLLQMCGQRLHRLSLTFGVELKHNHTNCSRKIPTEKVIRENIGSNGDDPPTETLRPTLDSDYAQTYFALLAYTHALTQPTSHLRVTLNQVLTDPATGRVEPYEVLRSNLKLRPVTSSRIPYREICMATLQEAEIQQKILAQAASSQQTKQIRCSIVQQDA